MTRIHIALLFAAVTVVVVRAEPPRVEYDGKAKALAVRDIPAKTLDSWRNQPPDDWTTILSVHVGNSTTAMLGKYRVERERVVFTPRFAFEPGLTYRVVVRAGGDAPATATVVIPKAVSATPTVIARVYPTSDRLPENQLKFYIHFSGQMRRGEAYEYIHLLDATGKEVNRPFLELAEELWDTDGKRFTLFLHPGRIKRGLRLREELGPPLVEGKKYTLLIDKAWRDVNGNTLKAEFRRSFLVEAPDDVQPNHKAWKLTPGKAGGTSPLVLKFPEPLDHALLQRMLWVVDSAGKPVAGDVATANTETEWRFTPKSAWTAGEYRLVIDTELEDLAGNNIARPFEVDEFKKIDKNLQQQTVERRFVVK